PEEGMALPLHQMLTGDDDPIVRSGIHRRPPGGVPPETQQSAGGGYGDGGAGYTGCRYVTVGGEERGEAVGDAEHRVPGRGEGEVRAGVDVGVDVGADVAGAVGVDVGVGALRPEDATEHVGVDDGPHFPGNDQRDDPPTEDVALPVPRAGRQDL